MAREQVKRKPAAKGGAALPLDGGVLMAQGERVENDPWTILTDSEEPIPEAGDVVVPLPRFVAERDALLARKGGRLGVLIGPADKVEDIAQDLRSFALVAVAFPAFRDGRGFTTGRLARERYGYSGEMRAVGDVLPDLLFYLMRCGFSSFTLRSPNPEEDFARAARTFSVSYQGSSDARLPVHRLRAQKRKDGAS